MKRVFSIFVAVLMLGVLVIPAFAEGNTTTLTTVVPEAEYTLTIPADMEIPFGTDGKYIGEVKVTAVGGFAAGKGVEITVSHTPFECPEVETSIPYRIGLGPNERFVSLWISSTTDPIKFSFYHTTGSSPDLQIDFDSGKYGAYLYFACASDDWNRALAGNYTSTLTFSASVVIKSE